jgi:hypothetical protein
LIGTPSEFITRTPEEIKLISASVLGTNMNEAIKYEAYYKIKQHAQNIRPTA